MQKPMLKNSVFNIIYTASNILFPFITSIYVSRILLPVGVGRLRVHKTLLRISLQQLPLGCHPMGFVNLQKLGRIPQKRTRCLRNCSLLI